MAFRMPAIRSPAGFGNLANFATGQSVATVYTRMFFDRQAVKDALRYMNFHGLSRASLAVRRIAQKSIKQRGHARPPTKIEQLNVGVPLSQLIQSGNLPPRTRGALVRKYREILERPASQPGTPPHTHVPSSVMVGFRRNIYNAWDSNTQSAVVGPSKKGKKWILPARHEFGLPVKLRHFMWHLPGRRPLMKWFDEDDDVGPHWLPTNERRRVLFPPRPFLRPALQRAVASGKVARAFRQTFGPLGSDGASGG